MSRVSGSCTITAGHGGNLRFSPGVNGSLGTGTSLEINPAQGVIGQISRLSILARTEMWYRMYTGPAPVFPTVAPNLVASTSLQDQGFDHLGAGESRDLGVDLQNVSLFDGITVFVVGAPANPPSGTTPESFVYEAQN